MSFEGPIISEHDCSGDIFLRLARQLVFVLGSFGSSTIYEVTRKGTNTGTLFVSFRGSFLSCPAILVTRDCLWIKPVKSFVEILFDNSSGETYLSRESNRDCNCP